MSAKILLIATIVSRSKRFAPFESASENDSYANLAQLCDDLGLDLHITHFENLESDNKAFVWVWREASWHLVNCRLAELSLCYADLPLNFPKAIRFEQALRAHSIKIINDPRLSNVLTDKLATYHLFSQYVPLTLDSGEPHVLAELRELELHPDLSIEKIFLKPRYGERGRGIRVTDLVGLATRPSVQRRGYVVQSFLETSRGVPELDIPGRHDVRLIVCNGDIVLAFARTPAEGSYVSNFAQGGRECSLPVERLPKRLVDFSSMIDAQLRHYGPRLYSLDLGLGTSGKIWIYELNTMPGLVWDKEIPETRPLHAAMQGTVAGWMRSSLN